MSENKKLYPWAPYDNTAPDAERIAWLEGMREYEYRERWFADRFLEQCDEWLAEIIRDLPAPQARPDRPATMGNYWRWVLWEDCMGHVPGQIERCLQALIAGAVFESRR